MGDIFKENVKLMKKQALPITIFAVVLVVLLVFSIALFKSVKNTAYNMLENTSAQQAVALTNDGNKHISVLEAVGDQMEDSGFVSSSISVKLTKLNYPVKNSDFIAMGYADKNGKSVISGKVIEKYKEKAARGTMDLSSERWMSMAKSGKNCTVAVKKDKVTGEACIIAAVPYTSNGTTEGVLFGIYPASSFAKILSGTAFNGKTDLYLVSGKTLEVAGEMSTGASVGNKTITRLVQLEGTENWRSVFKSYESNKTLTFDGTCTGDSCYCSVTGTSLTGWYLVSVVKESDVDAYFGYIDTYAIRLMVALLIIAVFVVAFYLRRERKNRQIVEKERDVLRQEEERYRFVERMSNSVIFEADLLTGAFRVNDAYEELFGRRIYVDDFRIDEQMTPNIMAEDLPEFIHFLRDVAAGLEGTREFRVTKEHTGEIVWFRADYRPIFDKNGKAVKEIGRFQDINDEHNTMEDLHKEAIHDPLTGILNRKGFEWEVNAAISMSTQREFHALLLLDIDHFKNINDTYGHTKGDEILKTIAGILEHNIRSTDYAGRAGGDEFYLFLRDAMSIETAEMIARKIDQTLEKEVIYGENIYARDTDGSKNEKLRVSCSMGISTYPKDGMTLMALFEKADTALYRAKNSGRNQYAVYDVDIDG